MAPAHPPAIMHKINCININDTFKPASKALKMINYLPMKYEATSGVTPKNVFLFAAAIGSTCLMIFEAAAAVDELPASALTLVMMVVVVF